MEYFYSSLNEFFTSIGWYPNLYYSSLASTSKRLLEFDVPTGLQLSLGKEISPVFSSCFSLGLPISYSYGYLVTNTPYKSSSPPSKTFPLLYPIYTSIPSCQKPLGIGHSLKPLDGQSLLFGRVFSGNHVEGFYAKALGKRNMLVAAGTSDWRSESPLNHFECQIVRQQESYTAEIGYNSDNQISGFSVLAFPKEAVSFGMEAYYTAKEKSGGLSLATRFTKNYSPTDPSIFSILTMIMNPVMGHLRSSYICTIRPNVYMGAQCDFNVWSYESDLSVGVEFAPPESGASLKGKVSLMNGVAVRYDGQIHDATVSVGVKTGWGPLAQPSFGIDLYL